MNNKIIVIGIIFVLLFTVNFNLNNSHASLNMLYQAPIILINNQNVSTPDPFQQMIKLNESNYKGYIIYNGSFANFEFVYGNGTVIPAWIESNNSGTLIIWLKIHSISASSSLTIYIDFASLTTNLLSGSGTTGIGEAPQLSKTYAQYDDGASVFNNYWNFIGTTISPVWTQVLPSGATITQNNGITFITSSSIGYVGLILINGIPSPQILEGDVTSWSGIAAGLAEQNGSAGNEPMYIFNGWTAGYEGYSSSTSQGMIGGFSSLSTTFAFTSGIEGLAWVGNSQEVWYNNYNAYTTSSNVAGNLPSTINPSFGIYANSLSTSITFQWLRTRAYPPNGVMPSVSFGTLSPIFKVSKSEEMNIHAKIYALNLSLPEEWGVYGFLNYTIYGNNYSIPVSNLTNNYYLNLSISYNFSVTNNTTLQYNLSLYAYKLQDYIAINHLNYRGRLNVITTQKEYNITLNDSIIKFENVNNFYYFWDNYGYKVIGSIIIIGLFLFFISRLRRMR